jgi:hypothetical protein
MTIALMLIATAFTSIALLPTDAHKPRWKIPSFDSLKMKLQKFGEVIEDTSFVNCTLQINRALGKLKVAEENNDLYYALK